MAATIVWAPTLAALDAALAAAQLAGRSTTVIAGQSVREQLSAAGARYDELNTAATRALMDAEEAQHLADLLAWVGQLTGPTGAFIQADLAVRYAESLQVTAQTGVELNPRIASLADGTRYVLAPTSLLAFEANDDAASSTMLLNAGSTPIWRVTALDAGFAGNRIACKVEDATDLRPEHCKITVKLGDYTEVYDNTDATNEGATLGTESLLVSFAQVGRGRPDNVAYDFLDGGHGRSIETLQTRCARGRQLSAISRVERDAIDVHLAACLEINNARPFYVSRLQNAENELNAALTEASAYLAWLAFA